MDYTAPGVLQARILEGVGVPFFRGSSPPRDPTQVSRITNRATKKAPHRQRGTIYKFRVIESYPRIWWSKYHSEEVYWWAIGTAIFWKEELPWWPND